MQPKKRPKITIVENVNGQTYGLSITQYQMVQINKQCGTQYHAPIPVIKQNCNQSKSRKVSLNVATGLVNNKSSVGHESKTHKKSCDQFS